MGGRNSGYGPNAKGGRLATCLVCGSYRTYLGHQLLFYDNSVRGSAEKRVIYWRRVKCTN